MSTVINLNASDSMELDRDISRFPELSDIQTIDSPFHPPMITDREGSGYHYRGHLHNPKRGPVPKKIEIREETSRYVDFYV
jgi:hypothetical protein